MTTSNCCRTGLRTSFTMWKSSVSTSKQSWILANINLKLSKQFCHVFLSWAPRSVSFELLERYSINDNKFSVLHEEFMPKKSRFVILLTCWLTGIHSKRWVMPRFHPDAIENDLYGTKFYPKNISESLHVVRNQKKMKYRVMFQFLNSIKIFYFCWQTNSNDFYTKLALKSS